MKTRGECQTALSTISGILMPLVKATDMAIFRISWSEACVAVVLAAKIALVSQYERHPAFRGTFVVGCRKIESSPWGGEVAAR